MNEFARFLAVGRFNTLLGYGIIFSCMYLAGMTPETGNMTAYAVGLVVSYGLHRKYTFNGRQYRLGQFIRFLAVIAAAYSSNLASSLILIYRIGVHEGVSQVLAGLAYVTASLLPNKYLVFGPPSRQLK